MSVKNILNTDDRFFSLPTNYLSSWDKPPITTSNIDFMGHVDETICLFAI